MKALITIGLAIAALLMFIAIASRKTAGAVLSNAVIAGAAFIVLVVIGSCIAVFVKRKKDAKSDGPAA